MRTRLALLLFAFTSSVVGADLGTLFHTPQEREKLDRLRRGVTEIPTAEAVVVPDPAITGYVKRSDGKSTVFLDKRPYPARDAKVQGMLEPRIIERYEPLPFSPPPVPAAAGANDKAEEKKPSSPQEPAAARAKSGKDD